MAPKSRTRSLSNKGRVTIVVAALLVTFLGFFFLRPKHPVPQPAASPKTFGEYKQTYAAYAGSASCKECHAALSELWAPSNHGRAERPVTAEDTTAFFPSQVFKHGTQQSQAQLLGSTPQITTMGPSGKSETFTPARVLGNDPLRQFLIPFPGGRYQVTEVAYDPHRKDWFNVYGNEDRQAGEWGHWTGRGMNWNNMCATCHNTRAHKNYQEATDSYSTSMAEPTVSCEACHGPMKNHVDWQHANPKKKGDPTLQKPTPAVTMETCAGCHSRRVNLTDDFAPGQSFHDHYSLTIVDETNTFYPDGQVWDEDFEYAAFSGSRMHRAGVTCVNCHDPHTAKVRLPGNLMCMSCHSGGWQNAPKIDPDTHSFHKVDPLYAKGDIQLLAKRPSEAVAKDGGECVNCHMPQTYYMQRHRRHDHGFTIPDPLLTKEHGIPNACSRCHTDKSNDWALEWTDKWYGQKMERPSRHRAKALAEARKGDSLARPKLVALLSGTESPYWKACAANLLERWVAEPETTTALIAATKDASPLVRSNAAQSLGTMVGSGLVESTLQELLKDPTRDVRHAAGWALRANLDPGTDQELRQVMDLAADQPTGQMQKGAYFFSKQQFDKSIEHYRKAADWNPGSGIVRHDLAVALSAANRPKEALEELQTACKLEPKSGDYQYKLALVWNELGETQKSVEALKTSVSLEPGHARAWYNLGLSLNAQQRPAEALSALGKAEVADPADPRAPFARATILLQMGQVEEARAAARKAGNYPPALELLQSINR